MPCACQQSLKILISVFEMAIHLKYAALLNNNLQLKVLWEKLKKESQFSGGTSRDDLLKPVIES